MSGLRRITAALIACVVGCGGDREIANPNPVRLVRPAVEPLSAMAVLGRAIFYDSAMSATGRVSCASCHRPETAYASFDNSSADKAIVRAVPSLRYAYRAPNFSIGPEEVDADEPSTSTDSMVPRGGLFWDGRVNTLQDQAMGPLFNPEEMANRDAASVAARLRRAPYASQFVPLFGAHIFDEPARLVDEAMFAVARFQIEDPSFHPYDSKYDAFLEGNATLSASEWRGLQAFEDPKRGNCAACHLDRPRGDGLPPVFTDYEYAALGVPPNAARIHGIDLGACGPLRSDLRTRTQYCGMFRTPSLRNTATRTSFFHNGVYRTLEQVLAFYNSRDTDRFGDIPPAYRGNIDTTDAPLDRKRGDPPAMSDQDMRDIIAFLKTLTDGYRPSRRGDIP